MSDALLVAAEAALTAGDLEGCAYLSGQIDAVLDAMPRPIVYRSPIHRGDSPQDPLEAAVALELGRPRWRNLPPIEQLRACAEDCRWRAALAEPYYPSAAMELEEVAAVLLARAQEMEERVREPIEVEPGGQLPHGWLERARQVPIHDVLTALGCSQTGRGRYTPCPACRGQSRSDKRGSVVLRGNRWSCVLCIEGGSAVDAAGWHVLGCEPAGGEQLSQVGAWLVSSGLI